MDMNDELRNLAWQCLPRETREKIRMIFNMPSKCGYPDSIRRCLLDIYGNILTSDTEPDEMLMISRKEVQRVYTEIPLRNTIAPGQAVKLSLNILFGDKCLPDKESGQSNLCDTCSNELKDYPDCLYFASCGIKSCSDFKSKEEPQPKFPIGSIVRITNKKNPYHGHKGKFGKVITYDAKFNRYAIDGIPSEWDEGDLEPYTEPETKDMEEKELNLTEKEAMRWAHANAPANVIDIVIKAFIAGKEFGCSSLSIDERLTQSEIGLARKAYAKYHPIEESYYAAGKAVCETLREIFGQNFFDGNSIPELKKT